MQIFSPEAAWHTAALVHIFNVHVKISVCIDPKKIARMLDWEEMDAELMHACGR
jgi:hypothetical protein